MKSSVLIATISALTLAACSGGGSEKSESETNAATANATAAPADAANTTQAANASAQAGGNAPAPDDVTTMTGVQLASFTGDPAAGEKVFIQCKTCHVTDRGQNRIGPSLAGIVGREAGTVAGYNYTPANKNSGITWSKEKLFQYLENPQRVVPGTKMAFAGIPDPQKRADLIEWLATK
jgi:cytochrome c